MRYLLTLPEQVAKNTADIAELKEKDREELWTDDCVDIFAHVLAHARFQDDEGVEKAKDLIESLGGTWPEPSFFRVTIPTVEGVDTLTITDADDVEIVDGDLVLEGTEITVRELTLLDGYHVVSFTYEMLEEEHDALIDSPIEVTGDIEFKLEIEADDQELQLTDDGDENVLLLRAALAKGDVTLAEGTYPVNDIIRVNGVTLDLNGSTLMFKEFQNALFVEGNEPAIKNGTIAGTYDKGLLKGEHAWDPNVPEEGYIPVETATHPASVGLSIGAAENYQIENVTFKNIRGYAINSEQAYDDHDGGLGYRTFSSSIEPAYGSCRFDLTHGTKYCCARSGVGENHIISDGKLRYVFNTGDEITAWPSDYVVIPEGATYVDVYHVGAYRPYIFVESDFNHEGRILECSFICNQRLGISNLPSYCDVSGCHSESNGYPRLEHDDMAADSTTSGFLDLEDQVPDAITISTCTSKNEALSLLISCYGGTIEAMRTENDDQPILIRNVYGTMNIIDSSVTSLDSAQANFNSGIHLWNTPQFDYARPLFEDKTLDPTVELFDKQIVPGVLTTSPIVERSVPHTITNGNFRTCLLSLFVAHGASYDFDQLAGTYANCKFTLECDWISDCNKAVDLTFDHCDIVSNGFKLINQKVTATNPRRIVFDHCTADVDFTELVNNTDWIEVIVLDDTLDDEWDNTTNQLNDSWGNNENLIDEWRN